MKILAMDLLPQDFLLVKAYNSLGIHYTLKQYVLHHFINIFYNTIFYYSPLIPDPERLDLAALHQPQSGVFSYVQKLLQFF